MKLIRVRQSLKLMYKHVLNNKLRLTVCLSNEEFEAKFGRWENGKRRVLGVYQSHTANSSVCLYSHGSALYGNMKIGDCLRLTD